MDDAGTNTSLDLRADLGPGYLWFAGAGIDAFTQAQTQAGSDRGPEIVVLPDLPVLSFHDLAFDAQGRLWTIPVSGDQIVRLAADQLDGQARPLPDLVVTSAALRGPQVLAFDGGGNLWVVNANGGGPSVSDVVRFDDPQALSGAQALTPSLTIAPAPSDAGTNRFRQLSALAFDRLGSLWLAGATGVLRIDRPASLRGSVAAAPAAVLSAGESLFVAIAFDANDALWITGANAGYFALRIEDPGASSGAVAPIPGARIGLPSASALFAGGMAFDLDGALWIAMSNQIVKVAQPSAVTGAVAAAPDLVLRLTTTAVPDLGSRLVFRPPSVGP